MRLPRIRPAVTLALVPALALACAPAAPRPHAREAEAAAALAHYAGLVKAVQGDSIAALYTPDGELVNAGMQPVVGPSAIRAFLASFAGVQVLANELVPEHTRVAADTVVQDGTFHQRVRLPSGDTVEPHGRFQATWLRDASGALKLRRMETWPAR